MQWQASLRHANSMATGLGETRQDQQYLARRQNTSGFASGKHANRERAGFLPAKQNQCLAMTVNCTDAEWESVPLFPTTARV
jgi:hypothetical protein